MPEVTKQLEVPKNLRLGSHPTTGVQWDSVEYASDYAVKELKVFSKNVTNLIESIKFSIE